MFGRFRNLLGVALILGIVVIGVVQISAQDEPVVYGVLFYSPSCPHCHTVITEYVPQWEEAFGESFILLFVNAATQGGGALFYATCDALEIENCGGVPMMVIGEEVMIGSRDIPERTPGLIRDGLAQGGIGLPPVPELQAAYYAAESTAEPEATEAAEATAEVTAEATGEPTATAPPANVDGGGLLLGTASTAPQSLADKLANDPQGNSIAIATLVVLAGSLVAGLWFGPRGMLKADTPIVHAAIDVILVGTVLIALSLAFESSGDTLAMVTSWGTLVLLVFCIATRIMSRSSPWTVPLIALAGLLVAIYLAQVEVSDSVATCGMVGDCNTVQQSSYAELFGVLPIGVMGVAGYIAIILAWAITYYRSDDSTLMLYARVALLGMAVFGVLFSTYLTFLEPFVIGATCAWCITSALTMMLLFWLVAPAGWAAYHQMFQSGDLVSDTV
jgi:uncharacterized membrane protein